jgi:hypothetical protein
MQINLMRLNLMAGLNPSAGGAENETLSRIALDPSLAYAFEPGAKIAASAEMPLEKVPAGVYLFCQVRNPPEAPRVEGENLATMISEMQSEALWQRYDLSKAETSVIIRRLFEDGANVTQVWRKI